MWITRHPYNDNYQLNSAIYIIAKLLLISFLPFYLPFVKVQVNCIPRALEGKDLICQAKSGMGKTAVFVLSVLHLLDKTPEPVSALVLTHTKELAYQIFKEFERLGKYLATTITSDVFIGGEPITEQIKKLSKAPPTIVVGTPGRILDLTRKGKLPLKKLRFFILDECDKMLEQPGS